MIRPRRKRTRWWRRVLVVCLPTLLLACADDLPPPQPEPEPEPGEASVGFADSVLSVAEGEPIEVTVSRTEPFGALSVEVVATAGSTADSSDFRLPNAPIEFVNGDSAVSFIVDTFIDPVVESTEVVELGLVPLDGDGVRAGSTCRVWIRDAGPQPTLSWSPRNPRFVEEGDDLHIFIVTGENLGGEERFEARFVDGTAMPGEDFRFFTAVYATPTHGGLLYLTLLGDEVSETTETMTLELVPASPDVFVPEPEITIELVDPGPPASPSGPIGFPLEPGSTWTYARWHWTTSEVPAYSEWIESVLESREIDGRTVAVVSEDGRHWSGWRQEGPVVYEYTGYPVVGEERDTVEVRRFFDFLTPEDRWEFVHVDTLINENWHRRHEWMENHGRVTVATPAGIFEDVHAFTYHESWRDDSIPWWESRSLTYYVADGVGIVEIRGTTSGRDSPGSRTRTELLGAVRGSSDISGPPDLRGR